NLTEYHRVTPRLYDGPLNIVEGRFGNNPNDKLFAYAMPWKEGFREINDDMLYSGGEPLHEREEYHIPLFDPIRGTWTTVLLSSELSMEVGRKVVRSTVEHWNNWRKTHPAD